MAKKRTKTLSYRRAVWVVDVSTDGDLEGLVRQAHKKLKTVEERRFSRMDGQNIQCIGYKERRAGGCLLHIVSETPGDHASTIPQRLNTAGVEVSTSPPPPQREYMDGDILALVLGNHVCVCSTGLRDASLTVYLHQLIEEATKKKANTMFDLLSVADANTIKMIEAQGVKSIELRGTLHEASGKYAKRKGEIPKALATAGKHLRAIFGDDPSHEDADNIDIVLSLHTDDRMKSGKVLGNARMIEIAREAIENDQDYVIVTRQGQRISPTEVYTKSVVEIDRFGKSVVRDKAWIALEKFLKNLTTTGVVKQ